MNYQCVVESGWVDVHICVRETLCVCVCVCVCVCMCVCVHMSVYK